MPRRKLALGPDVELERLWIFLERLARLRRNLLLYRHHGHILFIS
jgi:hypothetical protein